MEKTAVAVPPVYIEWSTGDQLTSGLQLHRSAVSENRQTVGVDLDSLHIRTRALPLLLVYLGVAFLELQKTRGGV